MMRILSFILILCSTLPTMGRSQSTKVASGESNIRIEPYVSLNEAKERVLELAKVDALIKEFGQYIEQQSNLDLQNGKVDFRSYGQTKVKGEWIRTLGDPEFKIDQRANRGSEERWISCRVRGEVRRAIPKADVEVELLSCPEKPCVTDRFKDEQLLYLYVKSPISGYLSVFLDDGEKVYRLLPYRSMEGQKSVKITADKEYILFSASKNKFNQASDGLQVFTERESEDNTLIVVFSENDYSKPRLNDEQVDANNFIIPQSLSKNYFENWLGNNRAAFSDFLDLKRRFVIQKTNSK